MNHKQRLEELHHAIASEEFEAGERKIANFMLSLIACMKAIVFDLEGINDKPMTDDEIDGTAMTDICFDFPGVCNACGEDEFLEDDDNGLCVDCYAERYGDYEDDEQTTSPIEQEAALPTKKLPGGIEPAAALPTKNLPGGIGRAGREALASESSDLDSVTDNYMWCPSCQSMLLNRDLPDGIVSCLDCGFTHFLGLESVYNALERMDEQATSDDETF